MSWHSPDPYFRSTGGLVDVRATYARKRKSSHPSRHPPQNEEGPSRFLGSTNPSSDAEVHPSPIPEVEDEARRTVADGELPHEEDEARRTTTNPSSSDRDRRAPALNNPESDDDFERRTKFRQDRPVPPPQKPKGKVASSRRTKTKIDRPVPATRKTRGQLASEERTKARHDHPVPPTQNRENGTFTTRLHYNGVFEAEEGCGRQYVNKEVEYIHK